MANNDEKIRRYLVPLLPFLLALLILLPRLLSPQFGLMDDAMTLSQAQSFLKGDFSMSHDMQAGRFRPVYWLYYTLVYALAGYHPFWFFVANLVLLWALLVEIRMLVKQAGGAEWQVLLASGLFLLSMPIIENFYTLSKGEPLQLVLMLGAVLLLNPKPSDQPKFPWAKSLLAALLILLAIMVKETAIALVPLAGLWALFSTLIKSNEAKTPQRYLWALTGAAVLATLLYFGSRQLVQSTPLFGGTYTDRYFFNLGETIQKLLRWITQFAYYFHYYVPIAIIWVWLLFTKTPISKELKINLFRWSTWWLAWFALFIPWDFAESYYLLPFALGGALLISLSAPVLFSAFKAQKKLGRALMTTLAIVAGALFLLTLPNYITNARIQLAFDKANVEMLDYVQEEIPVNATVFMNIEGANEYVEKMRIYLNEHLNREDIHYSHIDQTQMEHIIEQVGAFVLIPKIDNQPALSVRAGVEEYYQDIWDRTLSNLMVDRHISLFVNEESFRLMNVNLPVIFCRFGVDASFCQSSEPLIDSEMFTYGWEIIQIQ